MRPRFRRFLMTFLPPTVSMRALKPDVRVRALRTTGGGQIRGPVGGTDQEAGLKTVWHLVARAV